MARPIADARQLALTISFGVRLVNVLGDFTALRRLLWILLDNALKYTPPLGRVEVTLSATTIKATVIVRDSGAGISEADLPHIFDRFYRADPSRSQTEGAGLGLAIAKWIAEMHHAELTVSSRLKMGTVFQLDVPICSEAPILVEMSG